VGARTRRTWEGAPCSCELRGIEETCKETGELLYENFVCGKDLRRVVGRRGGGALRRCGGDPPRNRSSTRKARASTPRAAARAGRGRGSRASPAAFVGAARDRGRSVDRSGGRRAASHGVGRIFRSSTRPPFACAAALGVDALALRVDERFLGDHRRSGGALHPHDAQQPDVDPLPQRNFISNSPVPYTFLDPPKLTRTRRSLPRTSRTGSHATAPCSGGHSPYASSPLLPHRTPFDVHINIGEQNFDPGYPVLHFQDSSSHIHPRRPSRASFCGARRGRTRSTVGQADARRWRRQHGVSVELESHRSAHVAGDVNTMPRMTMAMQPLACPSPVPVALRTRPAPAMEHTSNRILTSPARSGRVRSWRS